MKISLLKEAIDTHHTNMSTQLYQNVWEPVEDISEETSYIDRGLKYLQSLSHLTGWFSRVSMLKVLDFLAMEPEPVEYLKEFWNSAEDKLDNDGNPRDLTTQELFDLYIDFYCREPSAELSIEFHFQDLRRALYRELGGENGMRELAAMRRNGGGLDFNTFNMFYNLMTITNPSYSARTFTPVQPQPQPQSTYQYLEHTLLGGTPASMIGTDRAAPSRSVIPTSDPIQSWLNFTAIQIQDNKPDVDAPDAKHSLLKNMY
jgi:hypothetical protein